MCFHETVHKCSDEHSVVFLSKLLDIGWQDNNNIIAIDLSPTNFDGLFAECTLNPDFCCVL